MRARLLLIVAGFTFVGVACGSSTTPAAPTTPPSPSGPPAPSTNASVAGDWTGTSVDSQGTTNVTWTVTQTGAQVSGTVQTRAPGIDDGSCNFCHRNKNGTFSGTVAGDVLTLNLKFAEGVEGDPTPICSATMTGSASGAAAGRLTGTYTGSDSCEGAFLNGTLAMTRR
jgi:hypothetical protein